MLITGLLVGILVGVILQRGQFCISGQLGLIIERRTMATTAPIAVAIAIQMIGFYLLASYKYITIPTATMPLWGTLVGALLFGLGMGIAGCCVTGQLFRAGQGLLSAWITLIIFAVTTIVTQTGVLKFWIADLLKAQTTLVTIPQTLHISSLWCIVPFLLYTVVAVVKWYRKPERYDEYWNGIASGFALGCAGVLAWPLSAEAGRDFGLSFTIPIGNLLQYMLLDQQRYLNWGTYLVIGILVGACAASMVKRQWRHDVVTPQIFAKSLVGGVLMGIGAALTGGCTMANVIVGTAYFSWQSWIATFVMMFGLWVARRWLQ